MIIKQKMYVVKWYDEDASLSAYSPDTDGCITLGEAKVEVEVEFDMPSDIEIRDKKIVSIKREIEQTKADAEVKTERLLGNIQQLMALEVTQ